MQINLALKLHLLASRRPGPYIFGVQLLRVLDFDVQASEGIPIPLPLKDVLKSPVLILILNPLK